MATTIHCQRSARGHAIEATRYCGPSDEGSDLIRIMIWVREKDNYSTNVKLNRQEWEWLRDDINKAFEEYPL